VERCAYAGPEALVSRFDGSFQSSWKNLAETGTIFLGKLLAT